MRKIGWFLGLCLGLLGSLGAQEEPVLLKGQISNAQGSEAFLYYFPTPIHPEPVRALGEVNEDGTFSIELPLDRPRFVRFAHGQEHSRLFLFPGDELQLSLDGKEFDESLRFQGEGPGVAASNYLAEWFLQFEDRSHQVEKMNAFKNAESLQELALGIEDRQKAAWEFWDSQQEKYSFEEPFVDLFEKDLTYQQALDRMRAPMYFAYYHKNAAEEAEPSQEYYAFLDELEWNDEASIFLKSYSQLIDAYLDTRVEERQADEGNPTEVKLELARELLEGPAFAAYQAYVVKSKLNYGNPLDVKPYYEELAEGEGKEYAQVLAPLYENAMRLAPGEPAPAFTLQTAEGEELSLEDLRGKVLYVDFWASWCGPCRAEMPSSRELIEQYADRDDVAFVFISIDDDEDAWRKAMKEEKLDGIHLYSQGFGSATPEAYNVNAIPNYFIIDAEGNIANPFPPRPSHEGVQAAIEKALQGPAPTKLGGR